MNRNKGFTLIELLVVISIIGTLSSIVLTSVTSAKAKANDSSTLSNLKQIQNSIELYQTDYGRYPKSEVTAACPITASYCSFQFDADLKPLLEPKYISKLTNRATGLTTSGAFYYMITRNTSNRFYCGGRLITNGYIIFFSSSNRPISNVPVFGYGSPSQLVSANNYYHCVASTS